MYECVATAATAPPVVQPAMYGCGVGSADVCEVSELASDGSLRLIIVRL